MTWAMSGTPRSGGVTFSHGWFRRRQSDNFGMHTFTLEYWQDEGWYVGRLKEVVGVASQGQTLVELEENIRDAYQLMAEMVSATRRGPRRHLPWVASSVACVGRNRAWRHLRRAGSAALSRKSRCAPGSVVRSSPRPPRSLRTTSPDPVRGLAPEAGIGVEEILPSRCAELDDAAPQ